MDETPKVRVAPTPILNPASKDIFDKFKSRRDGDITYVFVYRNGFFPACRVPDNCTSWMGQYRVAARVKFWAERGKSDKEISQLTLDDAMAFSRKHLRSRVYPRTLEGAVQTSLAYEKKGWNTRPTEFLEVPDHPDLVAFAFSTPKKMKIARSKAL